MYISETEHAIGENEAEAMEMAIEAQREIMTAQTVGDLLDRLPADLYRQLDNAIEGICAELVRLQAQREADG